MTKARSAFLFWSRLTLLFVFLVIAAGAIVRATGSGMGCPDWPKCFGHYIPPTELEQLMFEPGKQFKKGHFIIHHRALWKARQSFTAGSQIDMRDWEKYTRHDYAKFNPAHTWTEYINRLSGASLGVVAFITLLISIKLWREQRSIPLLSLLAVILIGFEAWLGATVVESNLEPAKITTHMIGAVIIVAVVMEMIRKARANAGLGSTRPVSRTTRYLVIVALVATVAQIILGTQVRESVDALDKVMNSEGRGLWIEKLGAEFQVHRVFAYIVILLNLGVLYLLRKTFTGTPVTLGLLVVGLLVLEWTTGVVLALLALPAYIQPVHLLLAVLIFAAQVKVWQYLRSPASSPQLIQEGAVVSPAMKASPEA